MRMQATEAPIRSFEQGFACFKGDQSQFMIKYKTVVLFLCKKHMLWVLIRSASPRRF